MKNLPSRHRTGAFADFLLSGAILPERRENSSIGEVGLDIHGWKCV
ncbi:MAG TPA: hypothetical protein VGG46_08165 [Terriglobales bacterium]